MNYELQKQDFKLGLNSEDEILQHLEQHFGCKLDKTHRYHPFDFECREKKILIELKTRRINHNQYDDLMIGSNKIKYGNSMIKNKDYKIFFIYKCLDGVYEYEYLKDNKLRCDMNGNLRRNDRCIPMSYIPTNELKMIKI